MNRKVRTNKRTLKSSRDYSYNKSVGLALSTEVTTDFCILYFLFRVNLLYNFTLRILAVVFMPSITIKFCGCPLILGRVSTSVRVSFEFTLKNCVFPVQYFLSEVIL